MESKMSSHKLYWVFVMYPLQSGGIELICPLSAQSGRNLVTCPLEFLARALGLKNN